MYGNQFQARLKAYPCFFASKSLTTSDKRSSHLQLSHATMLNLSIEQAKQDHSYQKGYRLLSRLREAKKLQMRVLSQ
jgi:hypothetical protein